LGLFEQLTLTDEELSLESRDTLVAHTDGLTDAVNRRDENYGHRSVWLSPPLVPQTLPQTCLLAFCKIWKPLQGPFVSQMTLPCLFWPGIRLGKQSSGTVDSSQ